MGKRGTRSSTSEKFQAFNKGKKRSQKVIHGKQITYRWKKNHPCKPMNQWTSCSAFLKGHIFAQSHIRKENILTVKCAKNQLTNIEKPRQYTHGSTKHFL